MRSLRSRIALAYVALIAIAMTVQGLVLVSSNVDVQTIVLSVVLTGVVTALVVVVLAVAIARTVTLQLERLRQVARALADGAFDERVDAGGGAEVADLTGAFNDMAGRLSTTMTTVAQERSRLEALLASSEDALIALDAVGVVRYLNSTAAGLLGQATGRPLVEIARNHELSEFLQAAGVVRRNAVQTGGAGRHSSAPIRLSPMEVWVQATASPIIGGGDWATLVILHDVTEVRRAEIMRRDFVANVSHELRTPLAGIKAVVETLQSGAMEDPVVAAEFLERVDAEVDRLVQLVEELLQLARIEAGAELSMADVAPSQLLAACVERFRHQAERAGVRLSLDAPATLPTIRADAARLDQAVGNLVHNALKFTPPDGEVTVAAAQAGGNFQISVSDTGIGIDPADLPRIFERFYVVDRARAARGTGLGLAIVKHVALAHGGTVDARSTPGHGSTFTITLPLPGDSRLP